MAKRIEIDGKYYRIRRGVLVLIPDKWLNKVTYKQTINKRQPVKRRTRKRYHKGKK